MFCPKCSTGFWKSEFTPSFFVASVKRLLIFLAHFENIATLSWKQKTFLLNFYKTFHRFFSFLAMWMVFYCNYQDKSSRPLKMMILYFMWLFVISKMSKSSKFEETTKTKLQKPTVIDKEYTTIIQTSLLPTTL